MGMGVLYLVCLGVEVTLKALLLLKDYEKYNGEIKKINHNLKRLTTEVISEYKVRPLSHRQNKEIELLSALYAKHVLRYGSPYATLVNPETIPSELTLRKMIAVIRIANRHITKI